MGTVPRSRNRMVLRCAVAIVAIASAAQAQQQAPPGSTTEKPAAPEGIALRVAHRLEESLAAVGLAVMVVLPLAEMVARELLRTGIPASQSIVQNLVLFIAVIVVTINFLVDLTYAALDPRIRYAD